MLVVLVGHRNINLTLFIDLIPDVVLAIVSIDNLYRNLLRLFFTCFDGDFEIVTARSTILGLFVTSLDDELDWLVDGTISKQTRTVTERFLGMSVQEECESGISRREIIAAKSELDDGVIASITLVGRDSRECCLIYKGTLGKCCTLWSSTNCGFSTGCEVD